MTVTFPIDLSTDVGKVRTLIPDKNPVWFAFQDEEIEVFLDLESDSIKEATALALETIASDIAMVDKVIETLDLKTDGAKTAESLLKRAALLREQADEEGGFGLVEYGDLTVFNAEEYRQKNGEYALDYLNW